MRRATFYSGRKHQRSMSYGPVEQFTDGAVERGTAFRIVTKSGNVKGEAMTVPEGLRGLHFPCECVSSRRGGYSEPWAEVAKNKLLPNGTKEEILNLVAQDPM